MDDVVILRSNPIDPSTDEGHAFVVDCVRAGEGVISDKDLQEKYELSPADWQNITKDAALGRAVRAERERRVFTGIAARESAARHFVKAPTILDQIMTGEQTNARHKIEAIKELRATAAIANPDRPMQTDRFIIRIDLTAGGGDVEVFDKAIKIDVSDGMIALEGKSDADE